jgi:glycosyltransferase involved in cell wall biosynthesis
VGILSREIAPYNILAGYFNKIYFFSYGDEGELQYKKHLAENIEIVCKKSTMHLKNYNWLLPFIHWSIIRKCRFLKTNQFRSRAALISKIINPKAKFILRTGYTASLFQKQQGLQVGMGLKIWEKMAYAMCDVGLTTSENDKNYLVETYKVRPGKISVIANYIDTALFRPLNPEKEEKKIVYAGRINQQKNLSMLVEALQGTGIKLDIIGSTQQPKEIKLKEEIVKLAEQLNVKVNFLGLTANEKLPEILGKYQVFVLPSLYEGMPKALLEAMSCGLACIATDVTGSREIIKDNETGLLVKTDPESLRNGILKLLNQATLRENLGTKARQYVIDNFSLTSQIKKELEIYENLI